MTLEAFSLRSSVFLVPAPEKQMPALPPHTEAAAAPALTPGEQRVPDHRSSLWEAIPVAGAAVLSSARMSPLISGTVIEESFCGPQMPVSSSPHGQHEFYPSGWEQRDMAGWGGGLDSALGSHPWASATVIDSSALPLTLSSLLAPCSSCHRDGCLQSAFFI